MSYLLFISLYSDIDYIKHIKSIIYNVHIALKESQSSPYVYIDVYYYWYYYMFTVYFLILMMT